MRVGILGGTFDPPHAGHLALAQAAIEQLLLDEILFLPANRNPFKQELNPSHAKDRLAMVRTMISSQPKMAVSDMEITRGGLSYTVDTLGELQMVSPAEYWFVLGADALKGISDWRNPQRLLRLCRLAVSIRPPETLERALSKLPTEFRDKIDVVNMPHIHVSSSDLRERIFQGTNVSPWVSPEVLRYIQEHKLYRG